MTDIDWSEFPAVDVPSEVPANQNIESEEILDVLVGLESQSSALSFVPSLTRRPELIDDFIRNFLVRTGMLRTLSEFETEWYERKSAKQLDSVLVNMQIPDCYQQNVALLERIQRLTDELSRTRSVTEKVREAWESLRKERDFHRFNHQRVQLERAQALRDLRRLQSQASVHAPVIDALKRKLEVVQKERSLAKLEVERLQALAGVQPSVRPPLAFTAPTAASTSRAEPLVIKARVGPSDESQDGDGDVDASAHDTSRSAPPILTLPLRGETQDSITAAIARVAASARVLEVGAGAAVTGGATLQDGESPISAVGAHPAKAVVGSGSEDGKWRIWALGGSGGAGGGPGGGAQILLESQGHAAWVSAIEFASVGDARVATAGGDGKVKIWRIGPRPTEETSFGDGAQPFLGLAWHCSAPVLAAACNDGSVRIWDAVAGRGIATLRGHGNAAVNAVGWFPQQSALFSCGARPDSYVVVWDPRSRLPELRLIPPAAGAGAGGSSGGGSAAAVSVAAVAPSVPWLLAAGCRDGVVAVWDLRAVRSNLPGSAHSGLAAPSSSPALSSSAFIGGGGSTSLGGVSNAGLLWSETFLPQSNSSTATSGAAGGSTSQEAGVAGLAFDSSGRALAAAIVGRGVVAIHGGDDGSFRRPLVSGVPDAPRSIRV